MKDRNGRKSEYKETTPLFVGAAGLQQPFERKSLHT